VIPKLEDCKPGLKPLGYTVLVAVEVHEEVTAGGIHVPEQFRNREDSASEKGRIVDVSPMAFQGGDWASSTPLKVGSAVLFQRYAGTETEGGDGRKYRIINDEDLKGVFDE
jgi:co-chaperonin GroES (HSP10)